MEKLSRDKLFSLEQYSQERDEFRKKVIAHKKNRRVPLGPNATLYFEDILTMQYQVQEMLRIEKIFEAKDIEEELAAYNPLIPDGTNFKATFMIEYPEVDDRKLALEKMIGIEDKVWVQVDGFEHVWAIADEDLERENAEKTSAVHFLRFELNPAMIRGLKEGAKLNMGIDHDAYRHLLEPVPENIRSSLLKDLD
ncbi:MAG: DUF3501 family protein [Gammaproteobacteria bacterium]|nr:DUF3501 family protein [Gammaproteobacteria bacterium]